jgi:heme-degrading monooxygenase HmoA
MNRRSYFKTMAALGAATTARGAAGSAGIQLHVEMEVDPAREKELLANYQKTFHPAIIKQPGFVDVKLMKLRSVPSGSAQPAPYRLLIAFQTEEQRLKWVATDLHQQVWPTLSKTLKNPEKVTAVLYDLA